MVTLPLVCHMKTMLLLALPKNKTHLYVKTNTYTYIAKSTCRERERSKFKSNPFETAVLQYLSKYDHSETVNYP